MTRTAIASLLLALVALNASPTRARAWEWFRSENDHVAEGNELLAAGDHAGALREYDLAARELPSEPGVHLDRGLALLAAGEFGEAREAFQMASDPPASAEIRAMAHYNIGLSYYREGDAMTSGAPATAPAPSGGMLGGLGGALGGILGGGAPTPGPSPSAPAEVDHAAARNLFREAADAFRESLRQVPGNRDAGWNLELALRRITEEEEAEREERENEESEEGEDGEEGEEGEESEESESGEEESEESGGEGEEEGEEGEEGSEGEEESEESSPGENGEEESESGEESESTEPGSEDGAEDGSEEGEESGSEEEGDASGSGTEGGDPAGESEGEGSEVDSGGTLDRSLPPDMARVLDALENGEENLAAARARGRGERDPRRVERDW